MFILSLLFANDEIIDFLKQKIHEISETFEVEILAIECDVDHVHIFFKAKPTLNIPNNALKTITSREIRRNFQKSRKSCGKTFSGLFLATTGQVTLDILKKYVESQGESNVD